MTERKIRIVLADDHGLFRAGVRRVLEAAPDLEVVGEAIDGHAAIAAVARWQPDLLLLDVSMPVLGGVEVVRKLQSSGGSTRILILSMHRSATYARELIRSGASGYILKDSDEGDLLAAVRAVAGGGAWLSPAVGADLVADYRAEVSRPIDRLSYRERQVLELLVKGKVNKEIAATLEISPHTVETHRSRIMEKLRVRSLQELIRVALLEGLDE